MQEDGIPLLRLGRKFSGHEVRALPPFWLGLRPRLGCSAGPRRPSLTRAHSKFIESTLPKFAAKHPEIEISVSPRPQKHPVVIAHYINGNTRPVCLKKLDQNQILNKIELLRDSTGETNKRVNKPVRSLNESVRGIWSPYHGDVTQV